MSASSLHVFLSPASVPEAGLEHTCPSRPAGVQASTGAATGAGAAREGLGGGQHSAQLDPHSQRRPCQGWHLDCQDSCGQRRLWWRWGSGPGHVRSMEVLWGAVLRSTRTCMAGGCPGRAGLKPGPHATGRGLGGGAGTGAGLRPGVLRSQRDPSGGGLVFRPRAPAGLWGPEQAGEMLAKFPSDPPIPQRSFSILADPLTEWTPPSVGTSPLPQLPSGAPVPSHLNFSSPSPSLPCPTWSHVDSSRALRCPRSPTSASSWVLFFWYFCILLSIICPNCICMQLFLVSYSFFVFCCSRRHLSRCKHCSKGSQVPGPSLSQRELDYRIQCFHFTDEKLKPWKING